MMKKTVGIRMLDGQWYIMSIFVDYDAAKNIRVPSKLNHIIKMKDTEIVFKNFSRSGRMLYIERRIGHESK